ncbi:MAG TPA: 3'-5' exonuclease, partial [Clostridia bacterium]|nr:3'-5' exonuclease [Clostridia bacterium]
IPAYGELAGGFFDAVEVRVFMDLMRVVDNRLQDIPLAAVLRSPIGGFSTEELIEMRTLYGKEASSASPWRCFDSLTAASKTDMDLGMKAKAFLERLSAWQELAGLTSVQALIARLLDDTDYALFCRALPGGRQREANLDALCEKARLFEATGASGLSAFLQYADKLRAMGAPGAAQSAGADVVRVMSIHASKGLEFPYVLVAGLARGFNIDSGRKRLILDARFGAAARFTLAGVRTQSLYARAIASRDERKSIAEEMRVLYVAMTRAREKLVLLCAAPRGDRLVARAALPQEPACIAQQKSFAEWLLGCIFHAREGEALRRRYGLPEPDEAESLPVAVSCEPLFASLLPGARMGEAAFERFRRHALSLGPDDALFSRAYAYCAEAEVPSKVSVTGLAGHEVKLAEAPDFLLAARMTPADRGTAYHLLMQRIALAPHGEDGVRAELARLAGAGLLSALQAEAVSPREIAAFFASPLGRRLVAAKTVRRETEFNISMSARALGLADNDAPVVLQGVIDCCFLENGRWTLVDYKTDSVPEGVSTHQAAQKHAHQVNLYAEALARLTGIPVAERYVYFFTKNQAVALSEDD